MQQRQPITVHVPLEPTRTPVPAAVEVRMLTPRHRTFRAARIWAACWVGATISVAIPILHFVLVPALLLLGPFAGLRAWRSSAVVLSGEFPCARCGAQQQVIEPEVGWPAEVSCGSCGAALELRPTHA